MSDPTYGECLVHNERVAVVSQTEAATMGIPYGCQACRTDLATRPDPETLTRQERANELTALLEGPAWGGFDVIWERTDALVGRDTYTHELAYPDLLVHEIVTRLVPSVEGIVAKFPPGTPVVVVEDRSTDEGAVG